MPRFEELSPQQRALQRKISSGALPASDRRILQARLLQRDGNRFAGATAIPTGVRASTGVDPSIVIAAVNGACAQMTPRGSDPPDVGVDGFDRVSEALQSCLNGQVARFSWVTRATAGLNVNWTVTGSFGASNFRIRNSGTGMGAMSTSSSTGRSTGTTTSSGSGTTSTVGVGGNVPVNVGVGQSTAASAGMSASTTSGRSTSTTTSSGQADAAAAGTGSSGAVMREEYECDIHYSYTVTSAMDNGFWSIADRLVNRASMRRREASNVNCGTAHFVWESPG